MYAGLHRSSCSGRAIIRGELGHGPLLDRPRPACRRRPRWGVQFCSYAEDRNLHLEGEMLYNAAQYGIRVTQRP